MGREVSLSYAALDRRVRALAACLTAAGVTHGDTVGLLATRSVGTVAGMLACLRIGAVFVPLDPVFAPEQLRSILDDASPVATLVAEDQTALAGDLGVARPVSLSPATSDDAGPAAAAGEIACILYTSGTTGRPKGVPVTTRAIAAMAMQEPIAMHPGDVALNAATVACDGSLYDIFVPLMSGAALAIVEAPTPSLDDIAGTMTRHGVTIASWYAGLHHLMIDHGIEAFATLRASLSGGDVMSVPHARRLLERFPDLALLNVYGPTETCAQSMWHRVTHADLERGAIAIGRALPGEEAVLLDTDLRPAQAGGTGQLALGGVGVSPGYSGEPGLTAAAFIADPRPGHDGTLYLTGDLARMDEDGLFHFHGRADRQVKFDGRRVELDGVEAAIRDLPGVTDAAVFAERDGDRVIRLAAFVMADGTDDGSALAARLRDLARDSISPSVFPARVIRCDSFPLTRAGKVDRKALAARLDAPAAAPAPVAVPAPRARDLRRTIAAIWQELLSCGTPGPEDTFFGLGGTSLQLIEAHARMEQRLERRFDMALLFEVPRLGDLAARLAGVATTEAQTASAEAADERAIAIVGMAARLPGCDTLEEFWTLVREGRSTIHRFDPASAEDAYDAAERAAPGYVPARSLLTDVDQFDAGFFDMRPREAAETDPQGRVFLELCQQALDDAGLDPARGGAVGICAGASMSTYLLENLLTDRAAVRRFTTGFQLDYTLLSGNDSDGIATRSAFRLGLTGPALSINTACSTSLTAIAQACTVLRAGGADAMLAGGVSITFPQKRGYIYQDGGMASPDGMCRPFDADAAGTVFGHGAGGLVLKRLSDALRDGDAIHAVIRGAGLNNDGADKMAYTAPSVRGQADAIRAALADAGLTGADVGYVECHGTATPLGDPIEIAGLRAAYGTGGQTALGAVKGNIGHLDAAAGVAGVIKAVLALQHGEIPPVANFRTLSPRIDLSDSPFDVPSTARAWPGDGPRRAGVSSFGVGGTNAHIVLEEAPSPAVQGAEGPVVLPLSARSPEALTRMAADLADRLDAPDAPTLADTALTLQQGRRRFAWRAAVSAGDRATAARRLRALRPPRAAVTDAPRLAFMFPGQGTQYPGMGAQPYADDAEYARWIDAGAEVLRPILGLDIRSLMLDPAADAAALNETAIAQPALLLTEVASARMWQARGLEPEICIGHSVGEFAAAVLTGVMTFEDAVRVIARRGALMQAQPRGAMLSVRADADAVRHVAGDGLDLAAINAPGACVLSGPDDAISGAEARFASHDIATRRLHTSHAFHSRMMDAVTQALCAEISGITLRAPDRTIISTVTGSPLTEEDARSPGYWAGQARASVDFQAAVQAVAETGSVAFLETGPGRTLSGFVTRILGRSSHHVVAQTQPDHAQSDTVKDMMAAAASSFWAAGLDVNIRDVSALGRTKARLPAYPFQRSRHWVDAPDIPAMPAGATVKESPAMPDTTFSADRKAGLIRDLAALIADLSGEDIGPDDAVTPFLEFGFDSLFMGQVSQAISRDFKVQVGFRRLLSDLGDLSALAAHLDAELPLEAAPAPVAATPDVPAPMPVPAPVAAPTDSLPPSRAAGAAGAPHDAVQALATAQLSAFQALCAQQLSSLGTAPAAAAAPAPVAESATNTAKLPESSAPSKAEAPETSDASAAGFKVGRGPSVTGGTMTDAQVAFARDLAERYAARFPKSKAQTAADRAVLADPRTAAGFRPEWKELVFPVVSEIAKGSHIRDIDGNDFVDLVNGFGQTAFGHSPDFVVRAVAAQMDKGFPIGPQAEQAGRVARRFARAVGHERVTFCNTGSEAVMAAMRLARTVTGRDKIVVFDGDYHGQFDEVLIKGRAKGGDPRPLPIAPGIPRTGLANMVVLNYGAEASLDWVRENADEIAAVVVEPVQSRHPGHRPEAFVRSLREITRDCGAALVIDEVVTGFRTSARGMQGVWGIQGDMATYGKVVGGGMPIGVLAGDRRFMDALDGGAWSYGDDSRPEAIPTFFAGTFVRHPLVLAAVEATLEHMEGPGAALWSDTAARTARVAARLSEIMRDRGLPDLIETYASWFVINVTEADPLATLLYPLMRLEGVHVLDGFCCFLTTAHTEADCARVVAAFETALDALLSVGILGTLRRDVREGGTTLAPAATGPVPLSPSQQEIWLGYQAGGTAAAAFNESGTLWLEGALDAPALDRALLALVQRHDALRARFAPGGTSFTVTDGADYSPDSVDLTGEDDPQAALDEIVAEDAATPYDLSGEPPFRTVLARMAEDRHALILSAHHIVCDGWSFGVLLDDLAALYAAECAGRAPDLPPAPSFAAHARMEARRLPDPATRDWWRARFATAPELPDLPADRPRGDVRSHAGATHVHEIGADVLSAARKLGAAHRCTLFATTFAAMQIMVHRLSGARDFALGVPTAAQQQMEDPSLIGHCVNFLPIRGQVYADASVADTLTTVRDGLMQAFDRQDTTFGAILATLDLPRRPGRLPLTEIEFNLEKDGAVPGMPGLTAEFRPNARQAVNFDLFFNLCETTSGIRIDAHYNADLYDAATVAGWTQLYEAILVAMARDAGATVGALDVPVPSAPVAETANTAPAPEPETDWAPTIEAIRLACTDDPQPGAMPGTIPALVARGADLAPDAIAVAAPGETGLTHAALSDRADALAALVQRSLPEPGGRIGVCLPRGTDLVAALLGVMKAGHAYVPLDPAQPADRLRAIAGAARIGAVLTDAPGTVTFDTGADVPVLLTGDASGAGAVRPVAISPADAAYVMFTSGSTGTPKGVEIPHRAVVNLLNSMADAPGLGPDDRLLAVTTAMFDISVLEFFLPLAVGARLDIAPADEVKDAFRLADRLREGGYTAMQATPTLWDMVLTAGFTPPAGMKLLCGGEPLPRDLADRLMRDGAELWNLYGPTETTIWSAAGPVPAEGPVTIGDPVARTSLLILDEAGNRVMPGETGELFIGGAGLAIGYFDRPDLTEAAFRTMQVDGVAQRLYATGDLAQRDVEGRITVLGRRDGQVKLRGFRIELGEIEAALRARPGISAAAVALRDKANGDRHLVAYVVPQADTAPDHAALAQALRTVLPDYMVPAAWMTLDALPQTPNGKLDRKALPDPAQGAAPVAAPTPAADAAPQTDTERRIAAIWSEVLGRDGIGVTDTLFSLGADSLTVFRIAARMLDTGLGLEARHMLAHPTIRALAAFHDSRDDSEGPAPVRPSLRAFRNGARRHVRGAAK